MIKLLAKLGAEDIPSYTIFTKQFIKFAIVGISNTLLSLAIYYILVLIGVNYILSYVVAFALSVLNAYYWSRKYVFKHSELNKVNQLARVYISYGFTFMLSTGLLLLMVDVLRISELIAPLINLSVTMPLNYLLNKFWAFR